MSDGLRVESYHVSMPQDARATLHLRRFCGDLSAPAIWLLHGAVENGRIFYSDSGKGLAPWLARQGFDVWVGDLRGRGGSRPRVDRHASYGQTQAILEDLPAMLDGIAGLKGERPRIWMAHSWGGVLQLSAFARLPSVRQGVQGVVFFGTKRCVRVQNLEKWLKIDLFWKNIGPFLASMYGFLPADRLRVGSDWETRASLRESVTWVRPGPWMDPQDGFDYAAAIRQVALPPIFSLTGSKDRALGHPSDVRDFILESGARDFRLDVIPGYGHIDLLTSPQAPESHFSAILAWVRERLCADFSI